MGALAVTSTILALVLVRFKRGASGWQPSSMAALVLRFLGHNTLEIYAAQLILFAHYLGDMAPFSVLARVCLLDRV